MGWRGGTGPPPTCVIVSFCTSCATLASSPNASSNGAADPSSAHDAAVWPCSPSDDGGAEGLAPARSSSRSVIASSRVKPVFTHFPHEVARQKETHQPGPPLARRRYWPSGWRSTCSSPASSRMHEAWTWPFVQHTYPPWSAGHWPPGHRAGATFRRTYTSLEPGEEDWQRDNGSKAAKAQTKGEASCEGPGRTLDSLEAHGHRLCLALHGEQGAQKVQVRVQTGRIGVIWLCIWMVRDVVVPALLRVEEQLGEPIERVERRA